MFEKHKTHALMALSLLFISLALIGCASSGSPYIAASDVEHVELGESRYHQFTYVRAFQDGDELVVYGRVDHTHGYCTAGGHVDVAILGTEQRVLESASIPIVNRGQRRTGWRGASFRIRLPAHRSPRIRLAFHDDTCLQKQTFDCGGNKAAYQ